jgi:hypothetical protein
MVYLGMEVTSSICYLVSMRNSFFRKKMNIKKVLLLLKRSWQLMITLVLYFKTVLSGYGAKTIVAKWESVLVSV